MIQRKANVRFKVNYGLRPVSRLAVSKLNSFGPMTLKFFPKQAGARPILANVPGSKAAFKMNWSLKTTKAILSYVFSNCETGSKSLGQKDLVRSWRNFVVPKRKIRQPVLMIKTDLHACFDCISHNKLLEILRKDLDPFSSFLVQRYRIVTQRKRPFGRVAKRSRQWVAWPANIANAKFTDYIAPEPQAVVTPCGEAEVVRARDVFAKVETLVRRQVLRLNGKHFVQTRGIPQGAILSTLLCNRYLGQMEREEWPNLLDNNGTEHFLVRHVDDFFLATTDFQAGYSFAEKIVYRGLTEYGMGGSCKKTEWAEGLSDSVEKTTGHSVSWCGLSFRTDSLEVEIDTSRWASPASARDSVRLGNLRNIPENIGNFLRNFISAKMLPMCMDRRINTRTCVGRSRTVIWNRAKQLCASLVAESKQKGVGMSDKFLAELEIELRQLLYRKN